jgi:integrase
MLAYLHKYLYTYLCKQNKKRGAEMNTTRPLTSDEVRAIRIAATTTRDRLLLEMGLTFGLRISESLSLNFDDISGSYLTIKSLKKSSNQTYPIAENIQLLVKELKVEYQAKGVIVSGSTALFLSRSKVRMTRQAASNVISSLSNDIGASGCVNTHSLRKTFINKIYKATNHDMVTTMNYSRHKTLTSIGHYLTANSDTSMVLNLNY